jgi:membrane fusion protein (multidrug efflux system)
VDRAIGTRWLITEGLRAGDRVILEGLQKVRPGVAVKVVPFEAKPAAAPAK